MEVRKRTKEGKSYKARLSQDLRLVAFTDEEVTLAFELEAHETEFSLKLNKYEARQIMLGLHDWLKEGIYATKKSIS